MIGTYLSLAIAVLKLVSAFMTWARERELISQGADAEIAKQALAIASKTAAAKVIMEKINAMSDAEVDSDLRGLEPK
jgi:Flp pilus assembly protein TadB